MDPDPLSIQTGTKRPSAVDGVFASPEFGVD